MTERTMITVWEILWMRKLSKGIEPTVVTLPRKPLVYYVEGGGIKTTLDPESDHDPKS